MWIVRLALARPYTFVVMALVVLLLTPVVLVDIDSAALQAKGLSATDVVNAVNAQNLILPTK